MPEQTYPDYTIIDIDLEIINIEGYILDFLNDIYKICVRMTGQARRL